MTRSLSRYAILLTLGLFVTTNALVAQGDYTEYKSTSSRKLLFEISFNQEVMEISLSKDLSWRYDVEDIKIRNNQAFHNQQLLFDNAGLHIEDSTIAFDRIYRTNITRREDTTFIRFYEQSDRLTRPSRIRRGNLISPDKKVTVKRDDFVRGLIFSVTGDIEVHGEVNRDVISLFGNITASAHASLRADVLTITGKIDIDMETIVYGELYSSDERVNAARHRSLQRLSPFDFTPSFRYDRVDGLGTYFQARYRDLDSLLPTFWGKIGYGFESKRGRYEFGIEQTLKRDWSLAIGGMAFRRLASEDDWLLSDFENFPMAIIAREDFKDYFESEGGTGYVSVKPWSHFQFTSSFSYEETNWLRAHPHLWSLFGGNKLFSPNFRSVKDATERTRGITEIDSSTTVTFSWQVEYSTVNSKDSFDSSAFSVMAAFEWSDSGFDSDFDYRKYMLDLRRYQKVTKYTTLIGRFMHGNSDGRLPIHKQYYLGGLGTLPGFDHKELIGTRFLMGNLEYNVRIPRRIFGVSVLYNLAHIANDTKLNGKIELKEDIGFAISIDRSVRVSFTKRMDRSFDDGPKILVRFSRSF